MSVIPYRPSFEARLQIDWSHPSTRGLVLAYLPVASNDGLWRDFTGNGRSATFTGGAVWRPTDPAGFAYTTNGTTQYSTTSDNAILRPETSSYSVMVLARSGATTGYIVCKGNKFSTTRGWSIQLVAAGRFYVRCNASNDTTQRAGSTQPSPGIFSGTSGLASCIMVIDREDGVIRGFANGSNNGWTAGAGGATSDSIVGFGSINDTNPIRIGANQDLTTFTAVDVALVYIWRRAIKHAEAAELHRDPFAFLRSVEFLGGDVAPPAMGVTYA